LLVCLGHFLVFSAFIFFHKLFNTKPDQKYFKWYDVGLFAVAQILIRFPASNSTECMVCKKKNTFVILFLFLVLIRFSFSTLYGPSEARRNLFLFVPTRKGYWNVSVKTAKIFK
jgi:hypothetical protein